MLVEHYGLGVLVCHLGHMTEDIFFCNNTKEASTKRETERGRQIYYVHLWQVRRELTSFSVAKFCRKVPMKCFFWNNYPQEMDWVDQIFALILMKFGNRQLTVSGLKKGRECGRLCRVTQGRKRYIISMSRQHLHSEKQVLGNWSETEWVNASISSTHSGLGEQESEVNFPTQIQEHI